MLAVAHNWIKEVFDTLTVNVNVLAGLAAAHNWIKEVFDTFTVNVIIIKRTGWVGSGPQLDQRGVG